MNRRDFVGSMVAGVVAAQIPAASRSAEETPSQDIAQTLDISRPTVSVG
ncbi:MAG: hypothetical protein ACYDA9_18605 [Terriglobia bacterium]